MGSFEPPISHDDLEAQITESVYSELDPQEMLLWAGRPRQGFRLRLTDIFVIPFSLLWGGFAIFWETLVIMNGAPFFFSLWGIPFVCVGIYFIAGRFFVDSYQRKHRSYVVTNSRVVILDRAWGRSIRSKSLNDLGELSLIVRSDSSGDIAFSQQYPWFIIEGFPQPGFPRPMVFEMIEFVRDVYGLIRNAQNDSQNSKIDSR